MLVDSLVLMMVDSKAGSLECPKAASMVGMSVVLKAMH